MYTTLTFGMDYYFDLIYFIRNIFHKNNIIFICSIIKKNLYLFNGNNRECDKKKLQW